MIGQPFLNRASEIETDALVDRLGRLAPKPFEISETGLSRNLLEELVLKHIYDHGTAELSELVRRLALAGPIIEEVLGWTKREGYIEVRGGLNGSAALRYALTDKGTAFATEALSRSGYIGPAPVPLEQYTSLVKAQSIRHHRITKQQMHTAFSDIVIREEILDGLGPALHSGKAIFIYGPPGSGKSFIAQRLARLLGDPVLIPLSIAVDNTVVRLFDPLIHRPIEQRNEHPGYMLNQGFDPRYVICERPSVVTGGELTMDMLEIHYDANTKEHQAPLQLKATNGIYVIDDLGRQRAPTVELFNRWIVPMESGQDYLGLASGKRFPVLFDLVLVFSTNLNPLQLADDAFLRRIGHKLRFKYLNAEEYSRIWQQVCLERGISFDPATLRYVLEELHGKKKVPLLACHPRDLLGMALDQALYTTGEKRVSVGMLEFAWKNYFVDLDENPEEITGGAFVQTSMARVN